MGLPYIILTCHPSEMRPGELATQLPPTEDIACIMRSLLMAELDRVRSEDVETRTLRNLWYTLAKPAFSKLGFLDPLTYYKLNQQGRGRKLDRIPNAGWVSKRLAERLSLALARMVRDGVTTYGEMRIIDTSRPRRPARPVTVSLLSIELIGAHYPEIILATEKDTRYQLIHDLASLYGLSAISCAGMSSFAAAEHLIDGIEARIDWDHPLAERIPLIVLGLTDYDPAGYEIFGSFVNQCRDVILSRGDRWSGIEETRLGLTPEQLSNDELEINTYYPPGKGLKSWFRDTGGVNGQPLGIELDALPLSQVRRMFADAIGTYIEDESIYHDGLRRALIDILINDAIKDHFNLDSLREQVVDRLKGSAHRLTCGDDLMRQAALEGNSLINPRDAFDPEGVADLLQYNI